MKLFKNAVREFSNTTMKEINEKIAIEDCIFDINLTTNVITEHIHKPRAGSID